MAVKTQLETQNGAAQQELTQDEINQTFAAMLTRMEGLAALERQVALTPTDPYELEAIRDGILGELLEKNPHEAIVEVVQSLAMLYEERFVTTEHDDRTVTRFATRDNQNNERLDDFYTIIQHRNGVLEISAACLPFVNMGSQVRVHDTHVRTSTMVGSYDIGTNPVEVRHDGSLNTHQQILREFYLRALSTAGIVLERRLRDPEAAHEADNQARAMLESRIASGEPLVANLSY
jgi:hypothetical protein